MRKLFIILVGLIAVVTFIRAFDNLNSLSIKFTPAASDEINSDIISSDIDLSDSKSGSETLH